MSQVMVPLPVAAFSGLTPLEALREILDGVEVYPDRASVDAAIQESPVPDGVGRYLFNHVTRSLDDPPYVRRKLAELLDTDERDALVILRAARRMVAPPPETPDAAEKPLRRIEVKALLLPTQWETSRDILKGKLRKRFADLREIGFIPSPDWVGRELKNAPRLCREAFLDTVFGGGRDWPRSAKRAQDVALGLTRARDQSELALWRHFWEESADAMGWKVKPLSNGRGGDFLAGVNYVRMAGWNFDQFLKWVKDLTRGTPERRFLLRLIPFVLDLGVLRGLRKVPVPMPGFKTVHDRLVRKGYSETQGQLGFWVRNLREIFCYFSLDRALRPESDNLVLLQRRVKWRAVLRLAFEEARHEKNPGLAAVQRIKEKQYQTLRRMVRNLLAGADDRPRLPAGQVEVPKTFVEDRAPMEAVILELAAEFGLAIKEPKKDQVVSHK